MKVKAIYNIKLFKNMNYTHIHKNVIQFKHTKMVAGVGIMGDFYFLPHTSISYLFGNGSRYFYNKAKT